ncbi:MAG: alpha-mannosidase, partial [Victivallales bacterium]|nr:alpha-mannosidase [Victivallales bacterium]
WFKGAVTVPEEAKGERIVLKLETGGMESIIWVDGISRGARDNSGRELLLTAKAKGGEKFEILAETFGGNPRTAGGGPRPEWFDAGEHVPAPQRLGRSTFGVWNEKLYQLWLDIECLLQLRDGIADKESLRVAEIDDALKAMTLAVDLELPAGERERTVQAGREILAKVLSCHNGSTAPMMSCFGHSHIDVAWLWTLEETERKCVRTFSNQLALMEQYPEYKFLQSQAYLYARVKTLYPDLYARIKAAVKRRQWIVEGSMWVEADTNITGGESLIRQFVKGKKFFKDEFGVNTEIMWLPDVFGYSGAVPQIMKGCGIKWFSTQKIFWTYNGADPFPYNIFWWQGIDGTKMLSYLHNDYNSQTNPNALFARWRERVQKDSIHSGRLVPFGYGDGGGGATREHLEFLRREADLEGLPKTRIVEPKAYFEGIDKKAALPTWVGELYYQCHRGTYTSQAKTKLGNRKSEVALHELEFWGGVAQTLKNWKFPAEKADRLWKGLLLNQFHDIIPGSSIHEVYQKAEKMYEEIQDEANGLTAEAIETLVQPDRKKVSYFNSMSFDRWAVVVLPFEGAQDAEGEPVAVQKLNGVTYAEIYLPACGWTTLTEAKPYLGDKEERVRATKTKLMNSVVEFGFNSLGELTSARNRASDQEFMAGPGNSLRMYKDVPGAYDAWDIDSMYKLTPFELERRATVEVVAQGPVFGMIRVRRRLNDSSFTQQIILTANSAHLVFQTTIDWRESHKMLKVNFPVNVHADDALHEIQFGHVSRPTHATRPYDANRFEVCNQKWTALVEGGQRGAAILNDCKYGVNVEGNSMNLTLLRSPLAPDHTADKGLQKFTYAFTMWEPEDEPDYVNLAVTLGYELNYPVQPMLGDAGEDRSLLRCDKANIILECLKPAEDGSGDLILRLYESNNVFTNCTLHLDLPFSKIYETDMLEGNGTALSYMTNSCECCRAEVDLTFRPFEIKTLRLKK